MAIKRTKLEKEVDEELIRKGKEALKDFDASKGIFIRGSKAKNRLISIRLPKVMIKELWEMAEKKGSIGYQPLIKLYISEGLLRDKHLLSGESKKEAA